LFVVGLLTSFHCVGMCGGINLSQCIPAAAAKAGNSSSPTVPRKALATIVPSLQYNLGRVAAYTLVGALVGALGSVIVFNGYMRGAVQLAAGVFMVLMSLGMMGILPGLSALGLRLPAPVSRLLGKLPLDGKSPLFVGLLTGLMPCGPLQAMQLFALGSGSAANGALAMLAFAAGTLPLMLGLGGLASALSARFAKRVMTVGACMVMLFGLLMFSSGWSLSGLPDVSALGREHLGHLAAFVAPGAGGGGGQAGDSAGSGGAGDSSASGSAGGSGGSAANSAGSGTSGSASAGTAGGATGGASGTPAGSAPAENGEQVVRSTLQRGSYPAITVSAGTPVRWLIEADARNINGCNNRFVADAFKLEHKFTPGENVVLFTPEKPGTYTYTCWMGMIRGTITVV
jgi:sulfite exporter TauE/SafE/plastocyanin